MPAPHIHSNTFVSAVFSRSGLTEFVLHGANLEGVTVTSLRIGTIAYTVMPVIGSDTRDGTILHLRASPSREDMESQEYENQPRETNTLELLEITVTNSDGETDDEAFHVMTKA